MPTPIGHPLKRLLIWTFLPLPVLMLPVIRAALQPTYSWGLVGISGVGLAGDYLWLVLLTAWAWSTLYLGSRGARWPFHLLLLAWHGLLTAAATYQTLTAEGFYLEGTTWDIRINLAFLAPLLLGAGLLAAALWVRRDLRSQAYRQRAFLPNPHRGRYLLLAAVLLPVEAALLLGGAVHGPLDALAVGLIITQALLLFLALLPMDQPADTAAFS